MHANTLEPLRLEHTCPSWCERNGRHDWRDECDVDEPGARWAHSRTWMVEGKAMVTVAELRDRDGRQVGVELWWEAQDWGADWFRQDATGDRMQRTVGAMAAALEDAAAFARQLRAQ